MTIAIGSVVLDVADVQRAARFWCDVLGYVPRDEPNAEFMVLVDPRRSWCNVSLQRNLGRKRGVNRVHMDLYTPDRDGEVRRIEALGGRALSWEYDPGHDHIVMADLDGNEFCVVQKA